MKLDTPLEKVVSGEWDREAFAAEFKKAEAENRRKAMLSQKLNLAMRGIGEQMRSGHSQQTIENCCDGGCGGRSVMAHS